MLGPPGVPGGPQVGRFDPRGLVHPLPDYERGSRLLSSHLVVLCVLSLTTNVAKKRDETDKSPVQQ